MAIKIPLNGNEIFNFSSEEPSSNSGYCKTRDVIYEEITYEDLVDKINNSELVPGKKYLITDYQTVHVIPNTEDINTGPIEPLIVTAISENEIAPIAYSQLYPQDIIYYHVGTDETNFPGATKGYISRRIDTIQNNDIGTDWRHCKYRRYKINQPNWDGAITYSKAAAVKRSTGTVAQQKEIYISLKDDNLNHAVTDTTWWRRFEWDNESYAAVSCPWLIVDDAFIMQIEADGNDYQDKLLFTYSVNIHNNEIKTYSLMNTTVGINFYNNSVGNYFYYNSVGNNFYNNSAGNDFSNNSIGSFYNNSVGNSFSYNSLGNNFYNNSVSNYFSSNSVGNGFSSNSVGHEFSNNSVGNYFNNNSVGNYFNYNSIGNSFNYNSIGNSFNNNSVGNGFNNNSVGNGFNNNSVGTNFMLNEVFGEVTGIDFLLATYVYNSYNKRIFKRVDGTVRLSYTNNSDLLIVVDAVS